MKRFKRIAAALLSLLAVFLLLPVQALAAGSIDLNRNVSLTISSQDENTPLAGAVFDIFLVGTVDETGELTTTKDFARFNVDIRGENDEAWRTLASTLQGYVLRDQPSPTDSGKTNENGLVTLPSAGKHLTPGLYLVLGQLLTQNGCYYEFAPFMVMLPGLDKEVNAWIYDVSVYAKFDADPIPQQPTTVTRTVLKVWDDEGYAQHRPNEITVQLLRDGKVFDTVILNTQNNWRHTWEQLESGHQWTVVEQELAAYTVRVTREGSTFVVTNTYDRPNSPTGPSKPGEPDMPQTGQLWWPVPVLIAAGLLFLLIGLVRRRGASHET